jgi:dual specificity protein kinase YAK1
MHNECFTQSSFVKNSGVVSPSMATAPEGFVPGAVIADAHGQGYRIVALLGQGSFGHVFKVQDSSFNHYALKVVSPNARQQSIATREVQMMTAVQEGASPSDSVHFARLFQSFTFQDHFCLLIELCYIDLYAALTRLDNHGFKMATVQTIARELFESLVILERDSIVHGDLKPENVMFQNSSCHSVKVIDFGLARLIGSRAPGYIQSRYYRAPEVVLGFPHGYEIDMWSVGCIIGEIFLGLPLFGGQNQIQLLHLHAQYIGPFPARYIALAPKTHEFFENGILKSEEQFCEEHGVAKAPVYSYFTENTLSGLITRYQWGIGQTSEERAKVANQRAVLLDLLMRIFVYEPDQRIRPAAALAHPFFDPNLLR